MNGPAAPLRRAARAARALRDLWAVAGLSLLLVVGLELGARLYASVFPPRTAESDLATVHPYAHEDWFPAWRRARAQHVCCSRIDFDPYRGWSVRPGRHDGLEVEASGRRRTVHSIPVDGAQPRRVLLFGGSTMWGYTARDAATIPSLVDAALAQAGVRDVVVENFAQSGFNVTQGLATLALELRAGARPAAAVFLDGVNEIGVVAEGGRPGEIYAERSARERFARGAGSNRELLVFLASRLELVKLLRSFAPKPGLSPVDVASACREIADQYARSLEVGQALGAAFDFPVLFFWQPTLAASGKRPGPWEAELLAERGTIGARVAEMTRACIPEVQARVAAQEAAPFHPLDDLYDDREQDQFLDHYGHVTEQANAVIAEAIAERLVPLLRTP